MQRIQKNKISTSRLVEYKDSRIFDIIDKIHDDELVLPSLQRKFVWKDSQITDLFDSIMQGYPIGTFMFWTIGKSKSDQNIKDGMKFYQFVNEYKKNDLGGGSEVQSKDKIECIVDGQQRLTSMLIGIKGSYQKHTVTAKMYINLSFHNESSTSSEESSIEIKEDRRKYEFSFKTYNQIKSIEQKYKSRNELWFPVNRVINKDVSFPSKWAKNEDTIKKNENKIIKKRQKFLDRSRKHLEETYGKLTENDWKKSRRKLIILWNKIHVDKIVSYFPLSKISLPDIIEIFIRVNNSGTNLTRTEMLMSVVSSIWKDGRDKIDELLKNINSYGYEFDTDFIMRASLVILDVQVLVNTRNVLDIANKLSNKWNIISSAVESAVKATKQMKFSKSILRSKNAIIPLSYYYSKIKDKSYDAKDEQQMKLYLNSVLILGFYGNHGDTALADIRSAMVKNTDNKPYELRDIHKNGFNFVDIASQYKKQVTEGKIRKDLLIESSDQIKELLETSYGSKSFIILACMNPKLINDYDNNLEKDVSKVHQDHLYPKSSFENYSKVIKKSKNLKEEYGQSLNDFSQKEGKLYNLINSLANIHIFEDFKNREKQNFEPQQFFNRLDKNTLNKHKQDNFIPLSKELNFVNFNDVIKQRKEIMRKILNTMFSVED
jgi:hypothetical protein|tara:strand:+ start:11489 stop:13465 length:1977 start_codon:yes stop_codon:yes gene_type:complete